MAIGSSKNSHVFNFEILLQLWKFDAHKIYVFYHSDLSSFIASHIIIIYTIYNIYSSINSSFYKEETELNKLSQLIPNTLYLDR